MAEKRQNPFKLRDFRGVNPVYIQKLASLGLKNAQQMLLAGRTINQRATLAKETGIPEAAILELFKLSDLARLPGVKGILTRLYYDAGVDSIEKIAGWEPEALQRLISEFVEQTGFDGVPPLPKEVSSTVANARRLLKMNEDLKTPEI